MTIVSLEDLDEQQLQVLTHFTWIAGRAHGPAWLPTRESARKEVSEAQEPGKVSRVAVDPDGAPMGWIAASHGWARLWEIHPLVVATEHQRQGVGRRLVREIEDHARSAGALTLMLGTSDTTGSTSLSGVDLYADPLGALASIEAHEPHAYQFWQRVGYHLIGVIPDAEGPGQPAIHLAKRLARQ